MNRHDVPPSLLDSSSGRYLLALALLILLHTPLLFLHTPRTTPGGSRQAAPAMVRFLPDRLATTSPAWNDLYAWSDLVNPQRGLHPGRRGGLTFSAPLHSSSVQPLPDLLLPATLPPPAPAADNPLLRALQHPLSETVWRNWPRLVIPPPSGLSRQPKESGVYWRLANGAPLQNPPDMPPEFAGLWRNTAETDRIQTSTRIEIDLRPPLPLPRLIVRASCGNPAFDLLAVKALRLKLGENPPPAAGNRTNQNWQLEIEWHRPPAS